MSNRTGTIARAETVGSLLQPDALLAARASSAEELRRSLEDVAVDEAIALQEEIGLDVITDGEMRRASWTHSVHYLNGLEPRPGLRSYPTSAAVNNDPAAVFPYVVERVTARTDRRLGEEYPYLARHAHSRTKYTMPAPSYFRRYWSDTASRDAYDSCEAFLSDVRDWLAGVSAWLVSNGCDYIQLDAPNYGSLCDPATRAWHESVGHDLDAEIAFDGALDSSVFADLPDNVTRALHICRGNQAGATWHSSGGYAVLADVLFPVLDLDVLLLEYDTDRAGDFAPLAQVRDDQIAVLGLLTTKEAALESQEAIETRLAEAATIRPLERLALSTQCGFASAANAPMTVDEERAKLLRVRQVASATWG